MRPSWAPHHYSPANVFGRLCKIIENVEHKIIEKKHTWPINTQKNLSLWSVYVGASSERQPSFCFIFYVLKGMPQYIRNYIRKCYYKIISHVSTVKECDYRSATLALIRSFAFVRTVLKYVYV